MKTRRRWDTVVVLGSIVGALSSFYQFMDSGAKRNDVVQAAVGRVSWFHNDLRRKVSSGFDWTPVRGLQELGLGDSIFTGKDSGTQIELFSGSSIRLGEMSLVTFVSRDGVKLPVLHDGNYRLQVEGNLRVSVEQEIFDISSSTAEVQIYLGKDHRPVFKNLSSGADVRVRHRGAERVIDFDRPQVIGGAGAGKTVRPEPPVLELVTGDARLVLPARFDEHYEFSSGILVRTSNLPGMARARLRLEWSLKPLGSLVSIQVAQDASFGKIIDHRQTTEDHIDLERLVYGDNYWRLSTDGRNWSSPVRARVEVEPWEISGLALSLPPSLELRGRSVSVEARVLAPAGAETFVLETSSHPSFPSEGTSFFLLRDAKADLSFDREGVFYCRVRVVDALRGLSRFSETAQLEVKKSLPLPLAKAPPPRRQVAAVAPAVPQQPLPSSAVEIPAPEAALSKKIEIVTSPSLNHQYSASALQIEGAGLAMYSRAEIERGNELKTAAAATVRDITWFGSHGIEGRVSSAVLSPVEDGSDTAPFSVEARYHRRWFWSGNPLPGPGESMISWSSGVESYRNRGSALMSPGYDLLKTGVGVEFPLWRNMDTGGEVLYGLGSDRSWKFEISGHLHVHLQRNWSVGMGYKVHLFEAGSAGASPRDLPYREGYGEAYSVLRWHY